jgi:hypothetical protein
VRGDTETPFFTSVYRLLQLRVVTKIGRAELDRRVPSGPSCDLLEHLIELRGVGRKPRRELQQWRRWRRR